MKTHPWRPIIFPNTKKILVGTLPPESAKFYFSNSTNTRLWDLLFSVRGDQDSVARGSNKLEANLKIKVLEELNLGITDIILKYEREEENSTKDKHINPKEYKKILELIEKTNIEEILFVYKNAAKWFLHSLENEYPKKVSRLKYPIVNGTFAEKIVGKRNVKLTLLPSPLNRGRVKGETLEFKLAVYKKHIRN